MNQMSQKRKRKLMNKHEIILFLKELRDKIICHFERYEPEKRFERKCWEHHSGGGGEISVIRGDVFEKAAVNFSAVSGDHFPAIDPSEEKEPFFATGVSLITHMANPHAPTVHMNLRYIETSKRCWFGGGYDLTPMGFPYEEDTHHFHQVAEQSLAAFGENLYNAFAENAKKYFFIPHWKKERGVGGIFFDHFNRGDLAKDILVWKSVGDSFLEGILPIYDRRVGQSFDGADRLKQLKLRAHYAEFNLLYDKGTRFGFLSGGNPEAILCSMPPLASW
ncbi:Oxygen-dependent coproporphyrinogen-III oxidase [Chlamydiales bacterium STE3]|nr:Oxygen-dependent coproporphyrinogen-III oxidase [Chlamydiales bacterium STE3]